MELDVETADLGSLPWMSFDSAIGYEAMEAMETLSSPPEIKPDVTMLQQQHQPAMPTATSAAAGSFFTLQRPNAAMLAHSMQVSPPGALHSPAVSMHSPADNGVHPSMQSPASTLSPDALLASPGSLTPLGSPNSGLGTPSSTMPGFGAMAMSTKHICAICGDRASGKHYGVYSCEGCKGFFKRTVRKDLTYACRDDKQCMIDKRQRNRCQFCRYRKCLQCGMKREAVQEERQRVKDKDGELDSTSSANSEMPVERITEAEYAVEPGNEHYVLDANIGDRQMHTLVEWAKRIPHFNSLALEDQLILLRGGSEIKVVLTELVAKMREMNMDRTELGCLRAIVLFNPDAKELSKMNLVETLREKVYASLEEYCKVTYPDEPGRFAKLLLRLPALRSIGLKCLEHLFFSKLIGNTPIDTSIIEMLDNGIS